MSSNSKPLITIVGATSKQGRSAAHTLLQTGRYRVRALTRKTDTPEAKSLAEKGAEVRGVPLEVGHKTELVEALRGSYGAFLMTPPLMPDSNEAGIGKQQADAALEAGVQHIVFSTLENVDRISGGKKYAPHFTEKAQVEEYIRTLPIASSFISLAYFYTNFVEYYPPRKEGDTLVFPMYLPKDFRAPFVDPLTATGPAVTEIFGNRDRYAGQFLPVVGELLTPGEMVETFERVTGKKAVYASAFERDEFVHHFPQFAQAEAFIRESEGMVQYTVEYGYYQKHRDLEWSRRVDPQALTWEQFLRKTEWQGETVSFGLQG